MDSVHHREAQYIPLDADYIIGCTEEHLGTTLQLEMFGTTRNLFYTEKVHEGRGYDALHRHVYDPPLALQFSCIGLGPHAGPSSCDRD